MMPEIDVKHGYFLNSENMPNEFFNVFIFYSIFNNFSGKSKNEHFIFLKRVY